MRIARKSPSGVPVLALVDAFVGGTAILLILIILSAKPDPTDGAQPLTDVTMVCVDGAVTLPGPLPEWMNAPATEAMSPQDAAAWVATAPPPDRLLLRVRLETSPAQGLCAMKFQRAVEARNDEINALTKSGPQPLAILATTLVLIPAKEPRP